MLGDDSRRLSPKRKGDKAILELCQDIDEAQKVEGMHDRVPELYLTCKPGNSKIYLRRVGSAHETLTRHPSYDSNLSREKNLIKLKKSYQISAGNGRVGYPYSMVYGGGVVAAAIDSTYSNVVMGKWYSMPYEGFEVDNAVNGVYIEGTVQDAINNRPDNT
jgi:hypothetical protein